MIYAKNSYMPKAHNRYEQAFEYMFVFSKGRPTTFNAIRIASKTAGTFRNREGSKAAETSYSERRRPERTVVRDDKIAPNVFFYDVGKGDTTNHNAPFPEPLVRDHILSWSNSGDLVFDPFLGSGTTAKMALHLQRRFIGCDISPEYVEMTKQRLLNVGLCV
jgi:site-specific DNA-methyltransferase (adenine-specific)